jgi:hypothetical protein
MLTGEKGGRSSRGPSAENFFLIVISFKITSSKHWPATQTQDQISENIVGQSTARPDSIQPQLLQKDTVGFT